MRKGVAIVSLVALCLLAFPSFPRAHDVPTEVLVQLFLKPDGNRLHVLVRLPLIVLLNMNLPKRGPGYLDLEQIDQPLVDSARSFADGVALFESDRRLQQCDVRETRISLPSDQSFATYDGAMAILQGPKLPASVDLFWNQGYFDAHLEYPIESDRSEFALRMMIAAGLAERTVTAVQFMPPGGAVRSYQLINDIGVVRLDPRWHQAALVFAEAGFFQVLDRIDFLLFLVCLVLPIRRAAGLVPVVGAFVVAHSVTLVAATYGVVPGGAWFPPLMDTLIALSIVYVAVEDALAVNLERRWITAFGFGLVHGFGLSFALQPTQQFAGSHLLVSLAAFNGGVELGLVMALAIAVPALTVVVSRPGAERAATLVLSILLAHAGWHWMTARADTLRMAQWPALNLALAVTLVRLALIIVVAAGVLWFAATQLRRRPVSREPMETGDELPWGAWDQASDPGQRTRSGADQTRVGRLDSRGALPHTPAHSLVGPQRPTPLVRWRAVRA